MLLKWNEVLRIQRQLHSRERFDGAQIFANRHLVTDNVGIAGKVIISAKLTTPRRSRSCYAAIVESATQRGIAAAAEVRAILKPRRACIHS